MTALFHSLQKAAARFARADDGAASLEFVIVFPVFFGFFLMTYESGMISTRHVMLERGVDVAIRDVRIGQIPNPSAEGLRTRICEVARIIPDCENQLEVEMVRRDPRAWVPLDADVECVNRGAETRPVVDFTNGDNNQLMIVRACVRIDPMLPTTGLGKAIVQSNNDDIAQGSYALVTTTAFVVEPFRAEEDEE